ncbi:MAG: HypC/HybG/HupF family hydrogenase formation chaperone [Actinomycetota bacterium]|nr:HypC/HybG/HupF family hydrogenase formation chaperone [Actinomycetota bacterium]
MTELAALIDERERVLGSFLEAEKGRIALACHAIARAFARGGTLIAYGSGPAVTDAAHVAVEFMHPVIVGKRALPAIAPPNDVLGLMRPGDIALSIAHGREDDAVCTFREEARRRELLTVALTGAGEHVEADFCFALASDDAALVQEVQETLYHVLWELVQVFFEHPGLLDDACITCGDVAVQAPVVAVSDDTAVIEKDGAREEVAVELVSPVDVGDVLLCHAGVAIEKVPR